MLSKLIFYIKCVFLKKVVIPKDAPLQLSMLSNEQMQLVLSPPCEHTYDHLWYPKGSRDTTAVMNGTEYKVHRNRCTKCHQWINHIGEQI